MYFCYFNNYNLPLEKGMALHLNKLESSSVQNVWLKLAQWFLRGRFLKILMYFCYVFCYNPPLEKGGALLLNRLQSHLPKDALYHFIWNWPIGSGVKKSFNFINFFLGYFVIISHWKREGTFLWTNLNPLHLRMLCAKSGWNLLYGSIEYF